MTRFQFSNASYDKAGEGKCWELWHAGVNQSPRCELDLDHEGDHKGNGMSWPKEPAVDAEAATKFLAYYRRIPNTNHEIVLLDDGTVHMTLRAFWATTAFLGVMPSSD